MLSNFVLLQEELAENIASLVNVFHTPDTGQCVDVLVQMYMYNNVLAPQCTYFDVGFGWSQCL